MIKKEVLEKIGFNEVIGTPFEELMTIRVFKAGDSIIDAVDTDTGALFIHRGVMVSTAYSSEGKELYRYYEEGSLTGVAESMAGGYISDFARIYGMDLRAVEDTTIVFIPFKDIFEYSRGDEVLFYRKIIDLIRREKSFDDSYNIGRLIYSDEEFILKAFEERGEFNAKRSDLARALNVSLRNLQRYVKYYIEIGILEKDGKHIYIKDRDKFNEYKSRVMDK